MSIEWQLARRENHKNPLLLIQYISNYIHCAIQSNQNISISIVNYTHLIGVVYVRSVVNKLRNDSSVALPSSHQQRGVSVLREVINVDIMQHIVIIEIIEY